MCKNFIKSGKCRFGVKCVFAHGIEELNTKESINDKKELIPCKHYHLKGLCKNGSRCQCLHE